jgi:hypothetical protein
MAKRKAARRKAVTTRRKAGRTRSASKQAAARKKALKKAVRRSAKAPRASVKATKKPARKSAAKRTARPRPAAKVVKRAAPMIGKVARPAAKPKAERAPARPAPGLNRERRIARDEDIVQTPPSSLDFDRSASAARSGRRELRERYDEHTETSPALTGGDVDADWESAYSVGDEAPGGDNPTPDQDLVDDIGRAVGVEYQDNEELKGEAKIAKRDRNRWELDPASSDDWDER